MFDWFRKRMKAKQVVPFTVVVTLRKSGKKRGIHSYTEEFKNVIKVERSQLAPYTNFDFTDGTRISIHRDRLLEWRSYLPPAN